MTTTPDEQSGFSDTLETRLVLALTVLGALLRLWAPGRLGLGHFDEGIYALAGSWVGRPDGLGPIVIPYAPAGYPLLVGVAYLVLGMSDLAPILVSVVVGTALIPLVGLVGRRLFGPGAGVAAAALAAVSGPHVAFSRMGLTDSLALLTWMLALVAGGWFLDRPRLGRAVLLGLAVGLAQNVKYSGFLSGVAVAVAAVVPGGGLSKAWVRSLGPTLGWGCVAALVSAAVYWPWFAFVERHGGYSALMAHHRGYVGGWSSWPGHFRVQMAEQTVLAGQLLGRLSWVAAAWGLAWLGGWLVLRRGRARLPASVAPSEDPARREPRPPETWKVMLPMAVVLGFVPTASWWVALVRAPVWLRSASGGLRVLGAAWGVQAVLTPFYHPYARLWLPLEALGWLALAELASGGALREATRESSSEPKERRGGRISVSAPVVAVVGALLFSVVAIPGARPWAGLLGPSDGLRNACDRVAETVGPSRDLGAFSGAKVHARPPVLFYLAQRGAGPLARVEDRAALFRPDGATVWVVEDTGVDGARPGDANPVPSGWQEVLRCPAPSTVPQRLDLDPTSALRADSRAADAARSELVLYRPTP